MARRQHEIRIGLIKARISRRQTGPNTRYSVAVVRLYRNGDVWSESSRFGPKDLPLVRLVLDRAHLWVLQQSQRIDS